MFDIPDCTDIAQLAAKIYESGGVLSAVCHGTVGGYRTCIRHVFLFPFKYM